MNNEITKNNNTLNLIIFIMNQFRKFSFNQNSNKSYTCLKQQ